MTATRNNPKTPKVVRETSKGPLYSKIVLGGVVGGMAQQLGRWILENFLELLG